MRPLRTRRSFLHTIVASVVGSSGCASLRKRKMRTYNADAPVDSTVEHPWPTLYGGPRRRNYRQTSIRISGTPSVASFADGGEHLRMQPIVTADSVVFGVESLKQPQDRTFSGLRSIGLSSSKTRWTVSEEKGMASPTVVGNTVFATAAGTTQALDRRDGSLYWTYEFGYGHPTNAPTVVDGRVYASGDGIVALDAKTGERLWKALDRGIAGTAATSSLVVGTLIDEEGGVYALDPRDGTIRWKSDTVGPSYAPPVIGDQNVYVVERNGIVHALTARTGEQRWRRSLGGLSSASLSFCDETVVGGATNGEELLALDPRTGDVQWTYTFGPRILRTPSIGGSSVYLPLDGDNGTIDVVDRATGVRSGRWTLPKAPSSGPALGRERIIISAGGRTSQSNVVVMDG